MKRGIPFWEVGTFKEPMVKQIN